MRPASPICLLCITLILAGGCGPGPSDDGRPGEPRSQPADAITSGPQTDSAAIRAVLPGLFTIMAGLQQDMAELDRGLWLEDFELVSSAAGAVADHPAIPPEEGEAIAGVLGPDMSDFQGMDTRVHDLAVRIRELAGESDLDAILEAQARLHEGCVTCHTRFRARLRKALR